MELKLDKMGDDFLIVISKEAISSLGWGHGDILSGSVENSALRIVRIQTAHDRAMQIASKAMDDYRETFEGLAKS